LFAAHDDERGACTKTAGKKIYGNTEAR
jgi:hypothetical protein